MKISFVVDVVVTVLVVEVVGSVVEVISNRSLICRLNNVGDRGQP